MTTSWFNWLWIALIACLLLLGYTYAGYPLIVAVLRRLFAREHRRDEALEPAVSFFIAARNEEENIARKLDDTLQLDYPSSKLEVVVASDGSTDRTDEIVGRYRDRNVMLLSAGEHLGKTESTNRAVPRSTGEILVFSDATGRFGHEAIRMLVRNFADPQVGAVTGRVVYRYGNTSSANGFRVYQRFVVASRRAESVFGTETSVSGSIHAIRRGLFRPAPSDLDFDMVHPLHVAMQGQRTVYEADAISEEDARQDVRNEFRARVRMAIQAYSFLPYLIRALPFCRNRLYKFQVLSHKVVRWLSPHALVLLLVLSAALAPSSGLAMTILSLQLAMYAAAIVAYLTQRLGRRIPGLAVPLFFCTINLAFLVGFWQWLRGERRGKWAPDR